jgi:hypothetical protein
MKAWVFILICMRIKIRTKVHFVLIFSQKRIKTNAKVKIRTKVHFVFIFSQKRIKTNAKVKIRTTVKSKGCKFLAMILTNKYNLKTSVIKTGKPHQ